MMKAITRSVSRNIARCELTFRERECVDYERAVQQHTSYRDMLRRAGAEVLNLEACDAHPDCCFVEDTAVVLDELAVIVNMGTPSRRGETAAVEKILSTQREVAHLAHPATLDGGDVIRLGKQIFVGHSKRTNREGVEALARLVSPFGYQVTPIRVAKCLHLSSACSALDEETVLLNPRWIDAEPLKRFRILLAAEDEPWAANTVRVGERVCVEAGAPRTLEIVGRHCRDTEALDVSEFRKAEGSLSCLSIIFRDVVQNPGKQSINQNQEVKYAE
ncbi:MAG TPA: arginine deiminase family protein [Pyrinomonadaceae bacterium]